MAPMYYRGANAAVLVYDMTQPASFADLQGWVKGARPGPTAAITCGPTILTGTRHAELRRNTDEKGGVVWVPREARFCPPPPSCRLTRRRRWREGRESGAGRGRQQGGPPRRH